MELDAKVAGWLATLSDRIGEAVEYNPGYGAFYIEEIKIAFDGEPSNIRLIPNDSGYFDISTGEV